MANMPTAHQKTLLVISDGDADVSSLLDSLVAEGAIFRWGDSLDWLHDLSGKPTSECPLLSLSVVSSDEDRKKAERFWHGAIEHDGSVSEAVLSVMRMDDAKRDKYVQRYRDIDRYVIEMCSFHADAILLPDGTFASNDGMRGRNQLHNWVVGFCDRFVTPLLDGDIHMAGALVARMFAYEPSITSKAGRRQEARESSERSKRNLFFARPADFLDHEGTVIELGAHVAILDADGQEVGYGEVCRFDEDSAQPVGVVSDLDSYSYHDVRWLASDEIMVL